MQDGFQNDVNKDKKLNYGKKNIYGTGFMVSTNAGFFYFLWPNKCEASFQKENPQYKNQWNGYKFIFWYSFCIKK